MQLKRRDAHLSARGFSIVELLVVIAVIGIMAGIAAPSIGTINAKGQQATAEHNAQNICSVYRAGVANGVVWGATDVAEAIAAVQRGGTGTDGSYFAVHGLDAAAFAAAEPKLGWIDGIGLVYKP